MVPDHHYVATSALCNQVTVKLYFTSDHHLVVASRFGVKKD